MLSLEESAHSQRGDNNVPHVNGVHINFSSASNGFKVFTGVMLLFEGMETSEGNSSVKNRRNGG